jgi:hypothetical protein
VNFFKEKNLSEEETGDISRYLLLEKLDAFEKVIEIQEEGDKFYYILQGEVSV